MNKSMKLKDIIYNDYFRLFVKREGKVVLGKHYSNLWLLCSVLFATFLAIAFSNASLDYLDYKMNDPFINWVDIENNFGEEDITGFEYFLNQESAKAQYHFRGFQTDKSRYPLFATSSSDSRNLKGRYYADIKTPLVQAILDEDNVVDGCCIENEKLDNNSFGVIITYDALVGKLGYKKAIPQFIYRRLYCDYEAAEFGVKVSDAGQADIPMPVLAVVKRLPNNMDVITTKYSYEQEIAHSLNMNNPVYFYSFVYHLPDKVDAEEFLEFLKKTTTENTDLTYYSNDNEQLSKMNCFGEGRFVSLKYDYEEDSDFEVNQRINDAVMAVYEKKGVVRVFDYDDNPTIPSPDDYISIHFDDLNKISDFQEFVKQEFKINIEMSQINAKENFNEVSMMANILSWTMIVFAIICIMLFVINLLQSYFQKVKRNLGTFKAFGMSNLRLISVYMLILITTISVSIVIALVAVVFLENLLPLFGAVKEGTFGYLALWSGKTLGSVVIILLAFICTVYVVMKRELRHTPGDLIYDR